MMQTVRFKMNFRYADLHCEGKALKTPTIKIGKCPNDTNGCDQPPMPTDQPRSRLLQAAVATSER